MTENEKNAVLTKSEQEIAHDITRSLKEISDHLRKISEGINSLCLEVRRVSNRG